MALSDWSPLAGVALGSLTTFGVTTYTQRRTDARERAHAAIERERTADAVAREERTRTFDHRRGAYEAFITDWNLIWIDRRTSPKFDIGQACDRLLARQAAVSLYGTIESDRAVTLCVDATIKVLQIDGPADAQTRDTLWKTMERFRAVVRSDLGVPDD